jgi:hypothetical protein
MKGAAYLLGSGSFCFVVLGGALIELRVLYHAVSLVAFLIGIEGACD